MYFKTEKKLLWARAATVITEQLLWGSETIKFSLCEYSYVSLDILMSYMWFYNLVLFC